MLEGSEDALEAVELQSEVLDHHVHVGGDADVRFRRYAGHFLKYGKSIASPGFHGKKTTKSFRLISDFAIRLTTPQY